MTGKLFCDSYAIIEYCRGNPAYRDILDKGAYVTALPNLMEVFYVLLREEGMDTARQALALFEQVLVPVEAADVEPAMRFRLEHKKRKLSYTDCAGYAIAKRLGIRFLTSDKEFKELPNVRFVMPIR